MALIQSGWSEPSEFGVRVRVYAASLSVEGQVNRWYALVSKAPADQAV
jgi:hypothetical protein